MAESGDNNNIQHNRYHKPSRDWAKREIRKLLISGVSPTQIAEQLKIPKRTCDRYIASMYAEDNQLLEAPSRQDIITQLALFKDKIATAEQSVFAIANDPEQDGDTRLAAWELFLEFAWGELKAVTEPPERILREMRASLVRKLQTPLPQQQPPAQLPQPVDKNKTDWFG